MKMAKPTIWILGAISGVFADSVSGGTETHGPHLSPIDLFDDRCVSVSMENSLDESLCYRVSLTVQEEFPGTEIHVDHYASVNPVSRNITIGRSGWPDNLHEVDAIILRCLELLLSPSDIHVHD